MELDEMKSAWLALDRRLERQEALNLHAFRESRLDRLRSSLRPLRVGRVVQIVAGVLLALVFAPFWVEHRDTPHLLAVGLSLHGYALMLILSAARDLYLLGRIDHAAPVLDIQRRLAELRAWLVRSAPLFGTVGCFIWIPFVLWLFEVLFGVDLYALHPGIVYQFFGWGVVGVLAIAVAIRWTRHPHRSHLAKLLEDSAAGRSIGKAQRSLDEIAAFAREA